MSEGCDGMRSLWCDRVVGCRLAGIIFMKLCENVLSLAALFGQLGFGTLVTQQPGQGTQIRNSVREGFIGFYALFTVHPCIGCPTRYRTRHFFNNSNTNEDIATKFEQQYVLFLHISYTMRLDRFKFRCNILITGKIIKEMPGSVARGTPCIIFVNKTNPVHNFSCMFISILYTFRASMCPSLVEITV